MTIQSGSLLKELTNFEAEVSMYIFSIRQNDVLYIFAYREVLTVISSLSTF